MNVTLIDHMGTDVSVVDAARVSFDKTSQPEADGSLSQRDTKLLAYLARHGHWSPFTHTALSFRVRAPIFVARQLAKHMVGLSWNEVSRRYVDTPPEFYDPPVFRQKAANVKQGSADEAVEQNPAAKHAYHAVLSVAEDAYKRLLKMGVCPEQARMALPQSMLTEWIWTGNVYAFHRVCTLRLDPHTQHETQEVAKQIDALCAKQFPASWKALNEARQNAIDAA